MKKVALSLLLASLLAACSSTPTKTEAPAKVEEVKVAPTPSVPFE